MSCEDHSHNHGDGDHNHSHVAPVPTLAAQLLNSKVDTFNVTALNVSNPKDDVPKLFKTAATRNELKPVIKSDADAQLILHIPFLNGSVKLHSVILRTNGADFCPKTIKLWKNNKSLDFESIDTKPHFQITHPRVGTDYADVDELPDELDNEAQFVEHHLPRHVFSGVRHLTLFVEDIYGNEEETHLHSVELRGEFTELLRDPVITVYESAANPADHKAIGTAYSFENSN